jgi:sterol desaturase/sphingolipid hydroxylase (fatty acid hydroxylase superfamily)
MFNNEPVFRFIFFLLAFLALALLEWRAPRRILTESKSSRWVMNISIVAIDTIFVRLTFPILPIGMAVLAQEQGWGLLNSYDLPRDIAVVLGVVILDLFIYFQHVMLHFVPVFWRLHMIHHTDLDFDITTGVRFHPLEIILSTGIKIAVVYIFGIPALGVLLYEAVLNRTSMLSHSNIRLPLEIDHWLRFMAVTPDMHRIHHSVIIKERNSNFSANLSWWDRLFGTYRAHPDKGQEGMTIGLANFRDFKSQNLWWLLVLPFAGKAK